MDQHKYEIEVPGAGSVSAIRTVTPSDEQDWTFIYAPGAGSNLHDSFGVYASRELAARGISTIQFQFPYMEARKRRPDPPLVLEATWSAVVAEFSSPGVRLVIGGRSMGGRIASHIVAKGAPVDGLALFAYPLHPVGQPLKLRDQHLDSIKVPTLFCSGTRDTFGTPDEMRAAVGKVPLSSYRILQDADHGFNVPKSSGRTRDDVWSEAVTELRNWATQLST